MTPSVFVVTCERINKRAWYKVSFQMNNQLNKKIESLPRDFRTFSVDDHCWHIHTKGLYDIIKTYNRSAKIKFEFGAQGRVDFLEQIKKIDQLEIDKTNKIEALKVKNADALAFKADLEANYKNYEAELLSYMKEGLKFYPYQISAAMFLRRVKSALLSMEMGLGKTLCSIAYVEMMGFKKVFVITPNSLKFNYFDEVAKFTKPGTKAHIINYKENKYSLEESKYVIVNYDYFNTSKTEKMLAKFNALDLGFLECVVCDESHMLKNTDSNTYKNFKRIFKNVPCKVFLSGTPAPNRAKELYTVLNQIARLDFPTKKFFYETYCGMIQDPDARGGWRYIEGMAKLEELFHKTAPYTYRKRKIDVLKDLPDKIYNRIVIEMTPEQQATYDKIEEGVANEIFADSQMSAVNILTIMLRLRQYTSLLKVEPVIELVERLLDEGEKSVVVDMFKPPLLKIQQRLGEDISVLHTGDQDVEERNKVKTDFQNPNGRSKVFLASIATTKYGLTLTAASKMFMLALPFSVGEYDQVADRLHRIGQKDTVFIYPLIVKGSIDEHVFNIIEKKRVEITKVMDNEDYVSNVEESILSEILTILKKKYKK
jgi:SNF2 family DNA or RNA helicase